MLLRAVLIFIVVISGVSSAPAALTPDIGTATSIHLSQKHQKSRFWTALRLIKDASASDNGVDNFAIAAFVVAMTPVLLGLIFLTINLYLVLLVLLASPVFAIVAFCLALASLKRKKKFGKKKGSGLAVAAIIISLLLALALTSVI